MNAFQVIFQTLASNYFVKHLSAVASLFLRSQHFKAPITKHPSMRISLLVNLFLPNTHNRELEHIVLLKAGGTLSRFDIASDSRSFSPNAK